MLDQILSKCCCLLFGFRRRQRVILQVGVARGVALEIAKSARLCQRMESGKLRVVVHQRSLTVYLKLLLAIVGGLPVRNVRVRGGQKTDWFIHFCMSLSRATK